MAGQPRRRAREGLDPHPLRTANPARGYSWRAFEPGNQVARTHGYWAKIDDTEVLEAVEDLYGHQPDLVRAYPVMARVGAEVWVRRQRALADIEARGLVVDVDGEPKQHPLLEHVDRCERRLLDLSARYGLDPRSDADLARARAGAVAAGIDVDSLIGAGKDTAAVRALDAERLDDAVLVDGGEVSA